MTDVAGCSWSQLKQVESSGQKLAAECPRLLLEGSGQIGMELQAEWLSS